MNSVNLILLGPPGAGKGTQAQMMVEHFKLPQISTGEILRGAIASGSELGEKVKSFVQSGSLVPDQLVITLLLERIQQNDCKSGYILDGFPRTVGQAEGLGEALGKKGSRLSSVIAIIVPDSELMERLAGRRTCNNCGASYHIKFTPPAKNDTCDKCGSGLVQRKDDSEEVISNRITVYHDQTSPLIDYYSKKNILRKVDGNRQIEMIFSEICDIIKGLSGG